MLDRFLKITFISLIFFFLNSNLIANEEFNFDITEIEIIENGNKVIGTNGGNVSTNDGITISANDFIYDKLKNILIANGNVVVKDIFNDYKIFSENIVYNKKDELISTNGKTTSKIYSRYEIKSKRIVFSRNDSILSSNDKTTIIDNKNNNLYNLKKFNFEIKKEVLKGKEILAIIDYNLPENDKLYFKNGIFDLKEKSFIAKDVEILLKKNAFDNEENDPRLKGVSAINKDNITSINKGIFTSCKKNDDCPPWSITAKEIVHNKNKKQMIYKDALLKIYNIPVLYFPKFFHPDPTVIRQSGLLMPQLNNSSILGSSINIPYYHVIAENKDFTFRPTIFDNDIMMIQNEYRQVNKNSSFILDFAYTDGYKSSSSVNKNSSSHLFANFDADLDLESFTNSNLFISIQKITKDTYLKIFDSNIFKSEVTPSNYNVLSSEAKLTLNNEDYSFNTGFQSFENLKLSNSDRYQFILPYYDYNRSVLNDFDKGYLSFSSKGSNELSNTNNLKTKVINNLGIKSLDLFTSNGLKSNFNLSLKNLNTMGKNDTRYKNSPQVELMSIIEFNSSLPLLKETNNNSNFLTPKISLRLNPGDMKDSSSVDRTINVDNIFEINRLGIDDSFEEGKSLTMGIDYKKVDLTNINKFFEAKLATVIRDQDENFIPKTSGIDKKTPNVFGSLKNNFSEFININYNFILDNDINTLEYNSINTSLNYKNFTTSFNFIEENKNFGDTNTLENKTSLKFNEENFLSFNTRRNRKINLTEYYDLVYEYKNDCLVAGIKYNKTYYEDRDLKPSENLLFTITLSPLTSFEQKIDQ